VAGPDDVVVLHNRGITFQELRRFEDALASYELALAARPDYAEALNSRGITLYKLRRFEDALASYGQALAVRPGYAEALNNRGNTLRELRRFEDALASYEQALVVWPDYADALNNRGIILHELKRFEDALASYERALAARPGYAEAHFNLALLQLLLGDFENGWREYEWRWHVTEYAPERLAKPDWTGGPTILLYAEQGLGDTLQFLRYCPLVARLGGRVILRVQPALVRLAASVEGASQVIAVGAALPEFDLCRPLLSLPGRFGTKLESIPAEIPYLSADAALVERWGRDIAGTPGLKVGLTWAGNPTHKNDRNRSIRLERLRPLLDLPGVSWFSLQIGERSGDIARLPAGSITDLSARLEDFAETAAVMAHLDLVVTVDTAIAHLAGALGRKAWVLLPFSADWRWLLDREDSPWYPTARLFRQREPGGWDDVIRRVAQAIAILATEFRSSQRQ
jgi:Tfp pilus assembly protein PilF